MQEEIHSHLELAAEDFRRRGVPDELALREARLKDGETGVAIDALRDQQGLPWVNDFKRDVGYAFRSLRRSPAFTVVSVISLALAIGTNTAMLSVINTVLLQPLPFRSPDRLVTLWSGKGENLSRLAYGTVEDWRRHSKTVADFAVLDPVSLNMTQADNAIRISGARVSPNLLPLLGIEPIQGRNFSDEEASLRKRVALISYRFWQDRFAGSSDTLGASIVLNGLPSQIIGILPEGLPAFNADVLEPHTLFPDWDARRTSRNGGSWFVFARLRGNASIDAAQSEISNIDAQLDDGLPSTDRDRGVTAQSLSRYIVGSRARFALWLLQSAVFCVLLIAMTNVASLSLSRNVVRTHEFSVRTILGASPTRVLRQVLTESMVLAMMSGLVGIFVAVGAIRVIKVFGPVNIARLNDANVDLRVLSWTFALCVVTGILVGIGPALTIRRRNMRRSIEEGGRTLGSGVRKRKTHRGLVVTEFALAIILMTAAGLLLRSWRELMTVDLGFKPDRVLSMNISTNASSPEEQAAFFKLVLEQVESVPGVESAGLIGDLFVSGDAEPFVLLEETGAPTRVRLRVDEVTDKLFATLGTPLLQGRTFSTEDRPDSAATAIINNTMARRLWPGHSPIGKRFKLGPENSAEPWMTVVGVVGDMRRQGIEVEPIAQVFAPLSQRPSRNEVLLVRTASEPLTMVSSVQSAVQRVRKQTPVYGVTTLEDRLRLSMTQRRFQTAVVTIFSCIGLLMAAMGIYGLIHYSVATRTQEIGLRMAIGAQRRDIFRTIIREGTHLVLLGLLIGLPTALLIVRAGSDFLFGVSTLDPITLVSVTLMLSAVAAAACYFPARRATKVDPIDALRQM